MTHDHDSHGPHDHLHPHEPGHVHEHATGEQLSPALDPSIDDGDLRPSELARRTFLRSAGMLGAGAAAVSVLGAAGAGTAAADDAAVRSQPRGGYRWLTGDHHIHTQYSPDAQYRLIDQVRHANAYGLDWMVITDHGSAQHARIGVEKVNPDIVAARRAVQDTLVF